MPREHAARNTLAFVIVAAALLVACGRIAGQSHTADEFQQRLFIASFSLGSGLDARYQQEEKRLQAVCKGRDPACFAKHFSAVRQRVATLRSQPRASAQVVGHLVAVLKVSDEEFGGLAIGIEVETSSDPARIGTWLKDVGDWGYGIHVSGVRPQGEWLQLTQVPFVGAAWLSATQPDLTAEVVPITNQILELQPLAATFPNGGKGAVTAGSYLVTRISEGRVEFRSEVATDFSCGEAVEPPRVMPPLLRAVPAEFFNADGTPRFVLKYQRGC